MSTLKHFGKFLLNHLNIAINTEVLEWEKIELQYENFKRGQEVEIQKQSVEVNRPGLLYINWVVATYFGEDAYDVRTFTRTRKREKVQARQIAHHIAVKKFMYTYQKVGDFYDKDHATVIHSCKTVNNLLDTDQRFKQMFFEITQKFNTNDNRNIESKSTDRGIKDVPVAAAENS